jgi:hypothetical protein
MAPDRGKETTMKIMKVIWIVVGLYVAWILALAGERLGLY